MKNLFINLRNRPILILLIIIAIFYFPIGLSAPPEGIDRLHSSTISIDKTEDGEIEIGLLSFITNQSDSYKESVFLLSEKATTIAKALDRISSISGKEVALTHTSVIVISKEVSQSYLVEILDFFFRNDYLDNDVHLICTNGKALDLLSLEQKTLQMSGIGLEELSIYNSKNLYFVDSNLESFYKGYFSPVKTSIISFIDPEIPSSTQQGQDSSSGSSGGSSGGSSTSNSSNNGSSSNENSSESNGSSSSGSGENSNGSSSSGSNSTPQNQNKLIKSNNQLGIFYNGTLKIVLDEYQINGLNWVNGRTKLVSFQIENFSDENFSNANITFYINSNMVDKNAFFRNGKPVIEFRLLPVLKIEEISQNEEIKSFYYNDIDYMTEKMVNKIESYIKKDFSASLKLLIENNTDVLQIYSTFNDQCYFPFKKWYDSLEDKEKFLEKVEYHLSVEPILTR